MMPTLLVVDDEANLRRMLAHLLEAEGYRTTAVGDGRAALAAVEREEPDAVLLDLAIPEPDGLAVLEMLRRDFPSLPIVMMSGRASLGDAVRATKLGAFHFIEKPLAPEAVLLTVKGAVELRRERERSRALAAELGPGDELVGSSQAMRATRELIRQVAPTDARVLLTGESGTGKELVAAALHALSRRAAGPFVRVNSAALPRELVESEMFGHEKGAFTGATERRRGRFELADGGTLFLDEVADLGPEAQAKLLRALEAGEIERVGGHEPLSVDVRVIAATHQDLRGAIAAGRFREDLFFRLEVVPIQLAPLRDRLEDVPELVAHFMAGIQRRHGLVPPAPTGAALERLRAYGWPGNVRELANICERLAILYAGREVDARAVAAVLPDGGVDATAGAHHVVAMDGAAQDGLPLRARLEAFERHTIAAALQAADGNVAEAARALKTDRPNLYRRMKRLGMDR